MLSIRGIIKEKALQGLMVMPAVFIVSFCLMNGNSASALTYQDNIDTSFTFNSSVSISLSSPQLIISELPATTYATSNIITLTAASNNASGYVVTATAGDGTTYNTTDLVNTTNSNLTFNSLATNASYDIASNDFAPGKWGYTYCNSDCSVESNWINATSGTGYSGLPLIGTTGAEIVSTNQATSTTTEFKIGAKATSTQLAGDYRNQVNFTVTANPPIPFCDTHTCMQDLNSTSIATLLPNVGDTATVYDNRDEQAYTIGKLADNKYWMLDNLVLDLTNDTILNSLTADNTNINTSTDPGALAALKGTTPGTTSDKYATAKVANWTSSYSFSAPLVNLTKKELPSSYSSSSDPMKDTVIANDWKIGGYYNYCAATAGSYCYGNGTSAGTSSGNATSSICPKGWRLPTSNGGETNALYTAYSSGSPDQYTAFRTAFHLPLSGYFYYGSADFQGSYGRWWSSTRYDNSNMYILYANKSNIDPARNGTRDIGTSIRCTLE